MEHHTETTNYSSAEARRGPIGFGCTRIYGSRWVRNGATLGRISFAWSPAISALTATIKAAYEFNGDETHKSAYIDIQGLRWRRIGVVPFAKLYDDRWQAKVRVGVTL